MKLNLKLHPDAETVIYTYIRSKVSDANSNGVVLGLSGGLDSAVVAKIALNALGKRNVLALLLPEKKGSDEHYQDAEDFVEELGIRFETIEIEPLLKALLDNLISLDPDDLVLANLKARIRAVIIFTYANSENLLVAGTSNKSEYMLGYFTKYGDGASDIAPIGDLYKTQVRILAKDLGIPEIFITKVPTAGLIKGQTDEDELGMAYDVLDRILLGLELKYPLEEISKILGLPLKKVEDISNLSYMNRHKRKFPKIPKMGIRTVGTDLRE